VLGGGVDVIKVGEEESLRAISFDFDFDNALD